MYSLARRYLVSPNKYEFWSDHTVLRIFSRTYGELRVKFDTEDFEKVKSKVHWVQVVVSLKDRKLFYPSSSPQEKLIDKSVQLHRFLMDAPVGSVVDHVSGNTLDARKSNLRITTRQMNVWNRPRARGYSLYKGRYVAKIKVNKIDISLGSYNTPEEAHQVYLNAKKHYHRGWNGTCK